jgi:NTE family protein
MKEGSERGVGPLLDRSKPKRAVVLSGGGARGAYEAGVLSFLLEQVPKRLDRPFNPDLVLGTSVGAIHACYLAATAHQEARGRSRRLRQTWQHMRFEDLFRIRMGEMLRVPRRLLGLLRAPQALRSENPPEKLYGLLDTHELEQLVFRSIPWRRIRSNLSEGRLEALCVTTTQVATGRTVVFVQGRDPVGMRAITNPSIVTRAARVGPAHALASAAIPVLFPAVRVGGTYYADGGLRMNTPLAPAIHLGADRILVVGLRSSTPSGDAAAVEESRVQEYGNPVFLYGKVLNVLLLDHLDSDLARMRLINSILQSGEKAYGNDFTEDLNAAAGRGRGPDSLRIIEDVVIRPSQDLGALAGDVLVRKRSEGRLPAWTRALLAGMPLEADLLSYLLFDSEYTGALMDLGYQDAVEREEELMAFFSDPTP